MDMLNILVAIVRIILMAVSMVIIATSDDLEEKRFYILLFCINSFTFKVEYNDKI